jgi:hypothetical protein
VRSFLPGIKFILIVALFAGPALAHANIGDTLPELRQRYGSAKDMGGQMLFEVRIKDGQIRPARGAADVENHLSVNVYFDGDHSAMEIFTRNTSDPAKAEMTQADVDVILAAADDGMTWNPMRLSTGKSGWMRSDNKLIARFRPNPTGKVDDAAVLVIMLNSR